MNAAAVECRDLLDVDVDDVRHLVLAFWRRLLDEERHRFVVAWHPQVPIAILRHKNRAGLCEWRNRNWVLFRPHQPVVVELDTSEVLARFGDALKVPPERWGGISFGFRPDQQLVAFEDGTGLPAGCVPLRDQLEIPRMFPMDPPGYGAGAAVRVTVQDGPNRAWDVSIPPAAFPRFAAALADVRLGSSRGRRLGIHSATVKGLVNPPRSARAVIHERP